MPIGIEPTTSAHGLKIVPRNIAPTAIAVTRGQMVGPIECSRTSAFASSTVVSTSSRSSTCSPRKTGNSSCSLHSGCPLVTKGMCAKLYGAGGELNRGKFLIVRGALSQQESSQESRCSLTESSKSVHCGTTPRLLAAAFYDSLQGSFSALARRKKPCVCPAIPWNLFHPNRS